MIFMYLQPFINQLVMGLTQVGAWIFLQALFSLLPK